MRLERLPAIPAGLLLASLWIHPAIVHAQSTAKLTGRVADPSDAAIAGAKIAAQPLESAGKPATVQSGPEGTFSLALAPGRYRVSIERASFARAEQQFTLAAGEVRTWNVRLELETMSSKVVVTAAAQPTTAETAATLVDVITKEQIDNRQETWLAPTLAASPGAIFSRLGPFGGITTFFLDGGNSDFTKFLVDGTPMNQPGGEIDLSNLDVENLDKIEIVHGAFSALYGSDAMDGVVQLFSHRGATRTPQLTLEGDGGTFDTGRGSGQLSGLLGAFDYSGSASYFSTDGQGPGNSFHDTGLSGNFGYKFSDTDQVRLTVRSANSQAQQPGQTLLEPPIIGQYGDLKDFFSNLSWDSSFDGRWQNHLAGMEMYNWELYVSPGSANATYQFNQAGFEDHLSESFRNGGATLGYEYEVQNGMPDGPHVRRNNQAGYAEMHYQFGRRLTAIAGARAEDNASFGTRVVPRMGANYALRFGNDFWGATRLRASYGQGIKAPTLIQSFSDDPCFPGDPNLQPERSDTFRAGVEQILASNRLRFSADYFHNHYYDIVSQTYDPAPMPGCPFGTGQYFNTDEARAFGANASFEAKATRWLSIAGNYTYDDTRVLKAPNAFDPTLAPGNRLFRRPLNSANLVFNAAFWRMNWNLAGTYVGRRTDSDFLGLGITSNPSFVRWDLAAMLPLGRGLFATAHLENLFDKHYQDAVGYPALGFNYRLGLKYTWGGERSQSQ